MQSVKVKKIRVIANSKKAREILEYVRQHQTRKDLSFIRENGDQRYSITILEVSEHLSPNVWRFVGESMIFVKARRVSVHKIRVRGEYSYDTGKGTLVIAHS